MKAIPRNDYLFVLPFEPVDKTKSGLFLSEFSQVRPTQGIVIALGPRVKDPEIKKGIRVIYGPFAPHHHRIMTEINNEERELYLMCEADIIAVVIEEE